MIAGILVWTSGAALAGTARYDRGDRLVAAGRYDEAFAVWRSALQKEGEDPELLLRAGITASMLGDFESAETYLRDAQRRAPDDPKIVYNLGLLSLRRGNAEEARARLREVLATCEWFPGAAYHLGVLAERDGDVAAAKAYYVREINATGGAGLAWQRYLALHGAPGSGRDRVVTWTMVAAGAGALLVAGLVGFLVRGKEKRIHGQ